MANPAEIRAWLKDAGARAYELEESDHPGGRLFIDILVGGSTAGVRVRSVDRQKYSCLTWSEIETAETNPLLRLIDVTIAAVEKR
jgi:hypothetical protein